MFDNQNSYYFIRTTPTSLLSVRFRTKAEQKSRCRLAFPLSDPQLSLYNDIAYSKGRKLPFWTVKHHLEQGNCNVTKSHQYYFKRTVYIILQTHFSCVEDKRKRYMLISTDKLPVEIAYLQVWFQSLLRVWDKRKFWSSRRHNESCALFFMVGGVNLI